MGIFPAEGFGQGLFGPSGKIKSFFFSFFFVFRGYMKIIGTLQKKDTQFLKISSHSPLDLVFQPFVVKQRIAYISSLQLKIKFNAVSQWPSDYHQTMSGNLHEAIAHFLD